MRVPSINRCPDLHDPVGCGKDIIVDERDDRASCLLDASISSVAQSLPWLEGVAHRDRGRLRDGIDDVRRPILRVVVDDDNLPFEGLRNLLGGKSAESALEEEGSLVGGNDGADLNHRRLFIRVTTLRAISESLQNCKEIGSGPLAVATSLIFRGGSSTQIPRGGPGVTRSRVLVIGPPCATPIPRIHSPSEHSTSFDGDVIAWRDPEEIQPKAGRAAMRIQA